MTLKGRMEACREETSVVLCEASVTPLWKLFRVIFITEAQRSTEFAQRHSLQARLLSFIILLMIVSLVSPITRSLAQDQRELEAQKIVSQKLKGEHALLELMRSRKSSLRPELMGVHPRVYVTDKELDELRQRARTTHRDLWQQALRKVRALKTEPAAPPAQQRRAQNEVGIGIAEAAFAYKIEGDRRYLEAAKKYMDAAVSYDLWGYANDKPNVDLAAGHLLYGLGWGYDLLYHDLSEQERAREREKLIKQARIMADYSIPIPGRTYAHSRINVLHTAQ